MTTYYEGAVIRLTTQDYPFTSIGGTVVTPDVVTLSIQIQGQTITTYTWTNPTGDPTSTLVNTATGIFHADLQTAGLPGTWNYVWSGQPSSGMDSTKTSAVWQGVVVVSQVTV